VLFDSGRGNSGMVLLVVSSTDVCTCNRVCWNENGAETLLLLLITPIEAGAKAFAAATASADKSILRFMITVQ
jgi:hypothetical protein